MRIFRFMRIDEFRRYLNGEQIVGKIRGKNYFLEGNIPAREKEDSIEQLTDITSLDFKSKDFMGQMEELSELISPIFQDGNFEGQLKKMEYLSLADFISKVRQGETHYEVLVEFETTPNFEQAMDKVIVNYQKYLIQEIHAKGYSIKNLQCASYILDPINHFKDGMGIDTIPKKMFTGIEDTLRDLETEEQLLRGNKTKKGKSGFDDCMNDDSVRISTEQAATRTVKSIVQNPDQTKKTEEKSDI